MRVVRRSRRQCGAMASRSPVPEQPKTIPQVLTELWELLLAYG